MANGEETMSNRRQRVQVELARCRAALLSAHAQLSQDIAVRLGDRLPTTRLIELYCRAQHLSELDEAWLRINAVAHAGGGWHADATEVHDGRTAADLWNSVRDNVRVHFAPLGDAALQERLQYEFAMARAVLIKVHVRNAVAMAERLSPDVAGPSAVAHYMDQMEVPDDMCGAIYALAVARLGASRGITMLASPATGRSIAAGAADVGTQSLAIGRQT
jgi:hypothetical protein